MKKNLLLHSILTLCVMLFTAMGFAQVNTNGGFENWTGSSPDGWMGSKSNIGADNVVQVTSGAHTGDYACQLINTASGHKRFTTQSIHVDNGTQYVISFWVKGGGDIRVAMYDGRETGSGYSPYSAYHSVNSTNYQQYTDTVVAANTTDVGEFILSVRSTNEDANHLIVDDVTIIAVTNEGFVAEPVATITGNLQSTDTYFSSATISLSTTTEGASIYYTLDGTEPTSSSTLYSSPFTITESATLKAMAELNGNVSSVLSKDITILELNPLFFENFENNGLNQMTVANVSGTYAWTANSYGGNNYAYANAYNQGATETWLITPSITPPGAGGVVLTFSTAKNYNGPGLQVKYSTNYSGTGDPSAATWTDITSDCALSAGSWNWVESGNVAVAGASPLHFAWVYTSEASSAAGWEVDNIMVMPVGAPALTPTLTITAPEDGAIFNVNDTLSLGVVIENFTLGVDGYLKVETPMLTVAGMSNPSYLGQYELNFLLQTVFTPLPVGIHTITTSLVDMNHAALDPAVSVTTTITVVLGQLSTPVFTPDAGTYTDSVTVTLACADNNAEIRYTLDGSEPTITSPIYIVPIPLTATTTVKAKAFKTNWLASETVTAVYTINSDASNDSVIYAVGFEDAEGFTASNTYNNTTVVFTGAEGAQWGTYYGTPSTNNHIVGDQSMQMRWYTSAPENIGYTYTNFDLHNVTHVTFAATSSNGLNVKVSHSIDGGTTYSAGQVFTLGSAAQVFDYVVDEEGSFNFVRLKFAIDLPETAPTANSRVVIDSIVVFGVQGQIPDIVTTPIITPNEGFYYEPQTITITCETEDAVIRYTTDGTEPTENSTVYSQPFTVNTTTTIMAKAWKTNMTPSFTATANISFPAQVANIAAFKAAASNEPQQIMSDVTFVFRSGRYMFVEDNTAAMLIFDNSNPVITTTYNEGDVIQAGVFGKYTTYQGMVEMVPTHNALEATGAPVTVTPANATITDIKTQYTDVYESKLVRLSDVTFISGTQFVQNGDTMAIYNRFNTVTTEISAGDLADVTGFVSYSTNYGYQIYPRGDEDINIHPVVIMDTVATPEFDWFKDGEFYRINITCATDGASIYYTQDGTDPDESSILFTGLFPLPLNVHYTLKAIAMKEGMVNSAIAVHDYNPTGVGSYELRDNLSIYPNPAINNATISVKNDNISIEKVELYNIYGQLLNTMKVNGSTAEISVNALATGTYFVKVFTDKGVVTMPMIRK